MGHPTDLQAHPGAADTAIQLSPRLTRRVVRAGLLARRPGHYAAKIATTVLALALGWGAFVVVGASWWTLGVAVVLAATYTQVAFLGHDAGHGQIFVSERANDRFGVLIADLGIGVHYGWWTGTHARLHARPGDLGADPDMGLGAPAADRTQAYLVVPMLLADGVTLRLASFRALAGRTRVSGRRAVVEYGLLLAHVGGYVTVVVATLTPWQAVAFVAVHQGLFVLYAGCSFALHHTGMPVLTGEHGLDHVERQLRTSCDVRANRFTGFWLGGLDHQIEHQLFPTVPRPNLGQARSVVRTFCAEHGLPFTESGLLSALLDHLFPSNARSRGGKRSFDRKR